MVVSNTSPIANLAVIGQLSLLKSLYGAIRIPEAVRAELAAERSVWDAVAGENWITTQPVQNRPLVESLLRQLHPGEAEAIALALEQEAELLLLDEHTGREAASSLGQKTVGLLGVLLHAKAVGLIPAVRPLLDALVTRAGFWMSRVLFERVLAEAREL